MLLLVPILAPAALKTMANDKFIVYYRTGMEHEAYHALQVLEYYRPRLEKMTGNTYGKAAIKLEDMGNLVNGFANPVGNVIGLYMYPPTSDELSFGEDWFQIVAPHEYIHQLQLSYEGGLPELMRSLFGNLLFVQMNQPMWMTEGITVYGESQLSEYAGRMNSAYYSAVIAALAREDKMPSPTKAAYYSADTPLAHYYVFGGSFHQYLAENYGEDKFSRLYMDNSSRIAAYSNGLTPALALDPAFQNTYGASLGTLWQDWQTREKMNAPALQRERITQDGWEKGNLSMQDGKLYYTHRKGFKTGPGRSFSYNSLMKIDTTVPGAAPQEILRQASGFPAGYKIRKDKVYYSRNEYQRGFSNKENEGFGAITQLVLLQDGSHKLLYEGQVRAFLPLENGTILIAEDMPYYRGSVLFEYDPLSESKTTLYEGEELIHGICMAEGEIFLNAKTYWSNSGIYRLEDAKLSTVINSPSKESLVCATSGKLYYNAVFEDKLEGFEYDLKTRAVRQMVSDDYLKDPVITDAKELYYLAMNSQGMDLYKSNADFQEPDIPTFKRIPAPFPKQEYQGQTTLHNGSPIVHGSYSQNIAHMLNPRMLRIPQIYGEQDSLAIGAILVGQDAAGDFPLWQIAAVYDTFRKKVIGDFSLSSKFLNPVNQDLLVSSDDDFTVQLNNSMALYRRQNFGLNSINLGIGIRTRNMFERNELYPFISQSLSWSSGQMGIRNTVFVEAKQGDLFQPKRLGWQGQVVLRQGFLALGSELNSIINLAYDPDAAYDDVFYPLRGYDQELSANKGITIRNTLYRPIFRIREGLWNPQIFLEDINLGLFYDLALKDGSEEPEEFSYGLELIGEFGLMFMGNANAGLRIGKTKAGDQFATVFLGTEF
jgi:hypothetical protein